MLICCVACKIGQSLYGILLFDSHVYAIHVLSRCRRHLQHAQGLIEVHGHADSCEILPNGFLKNGPETNLYLGVSQVWQLVPLSRIAIPITTICHAHYICQLLTPIVVIKYC
jgi:hypothetical protein